MAHDDKEREPAESSLSRRSFLALSGAAAASVVLPGIAPRPRGAGRLPAVPDATRVSGHRADDHAGAGLRGRPPGDDHAADLHVPRRRRGGEQPGQDRRRGSLERGARDPLRGHRAARARHARRPRGGSSGPPARSPTPPHLSARVEHLADHDTGVPVGVRQHPRQTRRAAPTAIVSLVYGLADRDDCVVNRLLDERRGRRDPGAEPRRPRRSTSAATRTRSTSTATTSGARSPRPTRRSS